MARFAPGLVGVALFALWPANVDSQSAKSKSLNANANSTTTSSPHYSLGHAVTSLGVCVLECLGLDGLTKFVVLTRFAQYGEAPIG